MELSFVLRDFKDIPALKIWFKFPVHYIDSANLLENCFVEGSWEANAAKNQNRVSEDEKRRIVEEAFWGCQSEGRARVSDMADYVERDKKTIRKYALELGDYDLSERGYIKRDIEGIPDVLK